MMVFMAMGFPVMGGMSVLVLGCVGIGVFTFSAFGAWLSPGRAGTPFQPQSIQHPYHPTPNQVNRAFADSAESTFFYQPFWVINQRAPGAPAFSTPPFHPLLNQLKAQRDQKFTMNNTNELGQSVGFPVEGWRPRPRPPRNAMTGRYCVVEPLQPDIHAADLYQAVMEDKEHRVWTYMPYGPFHTFENYRSWLESYCAGDDPLFHAVIDQKTSRATGVAGYLNVKPDVGVIEVGNINYSPLLQRKPAATEAMFLMMSRVFDELGYRRYEWKCDSLNAPSRGGAAAGLPVRGSVPAGGGLQGRNRDTAWFSIIDSEWPALKNAFERWLEPGNMDAQGRQIKRLSDFFDR